MNTWIMVGAGGALGALLRYTCIYFLPNSKSIWNGVLVVNLIGCFLMGFLYQYALAHTSTWFRPVVLIGFLGAFTTFSTYIWDISRFWDDTLLLRLMVYFVLSNGGGVILFILGRYLMQLIQSKPL